MLYRNFARTAERVRQIVAVHLKVRLLRGLAYAYFEHVIVVAVQVLPHANNARRYETRRSAPTCGLGSVGHHIEHFYFAGRCRLYLVAILYAVRIIVEIEQNPAALGIRAVFYEDGFCYVQRLGVERSPRTRIRAAYASAVYGEIVAVHGKVAPNALFFYSSFARASLPTAFRRGKHGEFQSAVFGFYSVPVRARLALVKVLFSKRKRVYIAVLGKRYAVVL